MSATINFGTTKSEAVRIQHHTLENNEVRNTTYFFREDLNWHLLVEMMRNDFPQKTDVFMAACSDGTEAYSLKMLLEKKAPEKKAIITAFDIVKERINEAQSGIVKIYSDCKNRITDFVGEEILDKNLEIIPPRNDYERIRDYRLYHTMPHMRENMQFNVRDVIDAVTKKKTEPCVFMCRNVWPYLKPNIRIDLAKMLKKSLPEGSVLTIGGYDDICKTSKLLLERGFEQIKGGMNLYRRK